MKIPFKETEVVFTVSGAGPAIVWLHGFLESKEIWKKQLTYFNSKFTNICIDLLGHGKTGCCLQEYSMELQAEAVACVLAHLKISSFSIVGHSMGGYVALALAENLEQQVSGIVLVNSTSYSDTEEKKKNRDRAIKIIETQKDSFVLMGIINLFSKANRELFLEEIKGLIENAQLMSSQSISSALKGMKHRKNRLETLKKYSGKKLIISGINDPILPHKDAVKEANNTQSELLALNSGHMSYIEACLELNEGLSRFIKIK